MQRNSLKDWRREKGDKAKGLKDKELWQNAYMEGEKQKMEGAEKNGKGGVWIYAQGDKERLHSFVYHLLKAGRELADSFCRPLGVMFAGYGVYPKELRELTEYGADEICIAEHGLLERYSSETFTEVVAAVAAEKEPSVILFPETDQGKEVAARAAVRLKTGLTADCTEFKIEDNSLIQIRPAFGDFLMAEIVTLGGGPAMACVKQGMFGKADRVSGRKGSISVLPVKLEEKERRTEVIASAAEYGKKKSLMSARIVVSGGMGIGRREGFSLLNELAEELGAAVGGTRPAAAAGWIEKEKVIGQTGCSVSPDIYIAVGISGAAQHMLGVSGARYKIAVNKSPDAPVFRQADLGFEADYREFLPKVIEKVRELKAKKMINRQKQP